MILDPINQKRVKEIHDELKTKYQTYLKPEEGERFLPGVKPRRAAVIHLTKLNGTPFVLNAELIETVETTPDTVISLVTGRKYLVRESAEDICRQYIEMKQKFYSRSGLKPEPKSP